MADYSNAYRLRKRSDLKPEEIAWLKQAGRWHEPAGTDTANDEFSLYDVNSKRGTIQKFDPRTKKLETIATGLRVPVALAFNGAGDLFNTDQEGETWMPNGNPLDELNHIIPGRNYGFPPRHERWLPDLVSEPPVVGFGPQHQSSCGLVFNEPRAKSAVSSRFKAQSRKVRSHCRFRPGRRCLRAGLVGGRRVRGGGIPWQNLARSTRQNSERLRRQAVHDRASFDAGDWTSRSHRAANCTSAVTAVRPTGALVRKARARFSRSPTPAPTRRSRWPYGRRARPKFASPSIGRWIRA